MSISDVDVDFLSQAHLEDRAKRAVQRGARDPALHGKAASALRRAAGRADADERAPAPLDANAVAHSSAVTAFTSDAGLAQTIRDALTDACSISVAQNLDDALELAAAGRCGVLVTDELSSVSVLRTMIETLRNVDPTIIVVAVGRAEDQHALMTLLSAGVVDRLLLKPLTPALAQTVVKSAAQQHRALQRGAPEVLPECEEQPSAAGAQRTLRRLEPTLGADLSQAPARIGAPRQQASFNGWRYLAFTALIVALGALAASLWYVMSQRSPVIDPGEVIERNLSAAQQAMEEGRVAAPAGRSAVDYYYAVLAIDPANGRAQLALAGITDTLMREAQDALAQGDIDAAVAALDGVHRILPEHARLALLQMQLTEAQNERQAQSVAPSAPADIDDEGLNGATAQPVIAAPPEAPTSASATSRRASLSSKTLTAGAPQTLSQWLDDAQAALDRQQLETAAASIASARNLGPPNERVLALEARLAAAQEERLKEGLLQLVLLRVADGQLLGANDSAKHHLQRLASLDPAYAGLSRGVEALGVRLLADANRAIEQEQFETANALLYEAREIGFSAQALRDVEAQLAAARASGAPFGSSASANPQAMEEPKLLRRVNPKYPSVAVRKGLEGWVVVDLRVSGSGDVLEANIAESSSGVFESAALDAVSKWKYEPFAAADPHYTHPVQTRFVFQLAESEGR